MTCVTSKGLVGLHMGLMRGEAATEQDLMKTFRPLAKGTIGMYIVGMIGCWKDRMTKPKNMTELFFEPNEGGTLIGKLREVTGYREMIFTYDTFVEKAEDQLVITARRVDKTALISYTSTKSDNKQLKQSEYDPVGGNLLMPRKCCVIF